MKQYKVTKELYPFVRRVLTKGFHKFSFNKKEDGNWICETPISSDKFHNIVQRAYCEKRSKEDGVFYVTSRERNSTLLLASLLEAANVKSYSVIDDPELNKSYN